MIKKVVDYVMKRRDPVAYFRKCGAIIGEDCEINCETLGGEPYLVSIGNHVRLNQGVQLITHDGGVWVLRKYSSMPNAEKMDKFGGGVLLLETMSMSGPMRLLCLGYT